MNKKSGDIVTILHKAKLATMSRQLKKIKKLKNELATTRQSKS